MIKRYRIDPTMYGKNCPYCESFEDENGDWVKHDDHESEIYSIKTSMLNSVHEIINNVCNTIMLEKRYENYNGLSYEERKVCDYFVLIDNLKSKFGNKYFS